MKKDKRTINIIVGPLLYLVCISFIPDSIFSTFEMKSAIGTVIWMAYWWVTCPVDYAITGLLPIAINAFTNMTNMSSILSNYSSETIMLLLGASILTASWDEIGLDKRIASKLLSYIGGNFRTQLIFWFLISVALSAILPNAVVCATIMPIAVSMLNYVGEGDIKNSKLGSKLLCYIAYGVGVGGLASPLGGSMNLVTISYIEQLTGKEYFYYSWVIKFLPIMIVLLISNIVFMLRNVNNNECLDKSKEYFINEYKKMPKMSKIEKCSLSLFLIATLLSFTRQYYQELIPGLKPAYVFIVCAILSFVFGYDKNVKVLSWKKIQGKIVWDLIFVFAGGLALGTLINDTGVAETFGKLIGSMNISNEFVLVLIIVVFTIVLSDVTSNTATASIAIPIVISIANGLNLNPIPYIYIASIGVNLSYTLPTSIRAIPIGYGLSPKYMLKEGLKITTIVIILVTIVSFILLKYWPEFSLV